MLCTIFNGAPPGKSVRPTPFGSSVSPVKRFELNDEANPAVSMAGRRQDSDRKLAEIKPLAGFLQIDKVARDNDLLAGSKDGSIDIGLPEQRPIRTMQVERQPGIGLDEPVDTADVVIMGVGVEDGSRRQLAGAKQIHIALWLRTGIDHQRPAAGSLHDVTILPPTSCGDAMNGFADDIPPKYNVCAVMLRAAGAAKKSIA